MINKEKQFSSMRKYTKRSMAYMYYNTTTEKNYRNYHPLPSTTIGLSD